LLGLTLVGIFSLFESGVSLIRVQLDALQVCIPTNITSRAQVNLALKRRAQECHNKCWLAKVYKTPTFGAVTRIPLDSRVIRRSEAWKRTEVANLGDPYISV